MIRVVLPAHLRVLAHVEGEVTLEITGPTTPRAIVAGLEARYPALSGTVIDPATGRRRPFVRFFVNGEDLSHEPADAPLPESVGTGLEPFFVIGAIAGG